MSPSCENHKRPPSSDSARTKLLKIVHDARCDAASPSGLLSLLGSLLPTPEAHSPCEGRAMSRLCSVAHSDPSARTVPLQLGLPGDPAPSVHALTRNVAGEAQPPSFPLPSARISSLPQSRACPAAYAGHTAAHAVATRVSRAPRAAVPRTAGGPFARRVLRQHPLREYELRRAFRPHRRRKRSEKRHRLLTLKSDSGSVVSYL